ncbi:hypothetical protein AAFF_G00346900 [Aldrovandia affinis]|uniref:Ig-like domain-containing protein n=1 Tax=Aldrovandia affinis TaxID=143900 RepID=A0AAD7SKS9_9TELE|nr:hypothetical protein AAFF_G00346900 [Aldrovandia affinis]
MVQEGGGDTCAGGASGLEITSSGPRSIEKASGDSVKLDCEFTLAPEDSGHLDVEWSLMASDSQNLDKVIILYSGGRVYEDYYPAMKGRMHFSSADPKEGDASVNLTRVETTDTGTYQCKVKKAPGIGSRKMFLSVMATVTAAEERQDVRYGRDIFACSAKKKELIQRPSKPQCFKEGPSKEGKDLVLRCLSSEGTNPLQYTWEKTSDGHLLPASALLDSISGTMSILPRVHQSPRAPPAAPPIIPERGHRPIITEHLRITPSPNTAGVIAGAVIGVLLALVLIPIILFCCCRARNKKKYEKEVAYEIKEDAPPPRCRVSMTRSLTSAGSQHSSLCSMSPSNMHEYAPKSQYDKVPTEECHAKLGGPNLSRMGAVPVMIPAQTSDASIV